MPVVTDVPVSPSLVMTESCDDVSVESDWEFVEPQSFSFSKKRSIVCAENEGEMSYEGTPVKAPPPLRSWQFASIVIDDVVEVHTAAVLQRKFDGTGPGAVEVLTVEGSRGKEFVLWQTMENAGKRPVHTRYVPFLRKGESEKVSEKCRERKAGRDTRPMATRVPRQ